MTGPSVSAGDDLDLIPLLRALAGRWRLLAGGALLGAVAGLGGSRLVTPLWEGSASVLVRGNTMLPAELQQGMAASLLGKDPGGELETEMALLRSRRLMSEVAEALPLGVRVRQPARRPALAIVASYRPDPVFRPVTVTGRREGREVVLDGFDAPVRGVVGQPVVTPVGAITFTDSAPAAFSLTLYDRDQGMQRALKRLSVSREGGDVAEVKVRWDDSLTSALLPNRLVTRYLAWRVDDDEGRTAARLRFVNAQGDSVQRLLTSTLDSLRRFQERTAQLDPTATGRVLLDQAVAIDGRLRAVSVEAGALQALLDRLARGDSAVARQLPAFPAFVNSPAINDLLSQLFALEGERQSFLAARTSTDPQVEGRTKTIRQLEAQLEPLARTYLGALEADRRSLAATVDSIRGRLALVPGDGRRYFDLSRRVEALNQFLITLDAQTLQLRVAAVEHGGRARQVDIATPTRKPARPSLPLFVGGGGALGLLLALGTVLLAMPHRHRDRSG